MITITITPAPPPIIAYITVSSSPLSPSSLPFDGVGTSLLVNVGCGRELEELEEGGVFNDVGMKLLVNVGCSWKLEELEEGVTVADALE